MLQLGINIEKLHDMVNSLPYPYKDVLLRQLEGEEADEIASVMEIDKKDVPRIARDGQMMLRGFCLNNGLERSDFD